MAHDYIPFSRPLIGEKEINEVVDSLRSGWITTGPKVSKFEEAVCAYTGAKHAAATFSCTAALTLGVRALGIGAGDEVILPTFTFTASAQAIVQNGGKPVFVDLAPDNTFLMDLDKVEAAITPQTKAIMPVHYGGNPVDMDALMALAKRHGLLVIEDAAHAIGTLYKGRKVGSLDSDASCLSFYATKNMTTAEGGMLVSNNEAVARMVKKLTMYGISDSREIWNSRYSKQGHWFYDVEIVGDKANMTDLCAAMGLHQLAALEDFIAVRGAHAGAYIKAFEGTGIETMRVEPENRCAWHLFPILLPAGVDRADFIAAMQERNIGTSVLFRPLHLHTAYRNLLGTKEGDFPVTEAMFERLVNLPVSPSVSADDVQYVAEQVRDVVLK